jgi:hypothetical protein
MPIDRAQRRALRDRLWSQQMTLALDQPALPAPAESVFELPEPTRVTMLFSPPSVHKPERTAHRATEVSAKQAARAGKSRRHIRAAAHRRPAAARHAHHAKPAKKRVVHVAEEQR